MGASRKLVQSAEGWRDSPPDLTVGEHDLLCAMIELAWHDVQIRLDDIPTTRREEALAAKVTAYEWITSNEDYVLSFRSVCLLLGLEDIDRARSVILRGVEIPKEPVSDKWRREFARTERTDRSYNKRQKQLPCAVLDEDLRRYSLETLVSEITVPVEPAASVDALAAWELIAADEGHEEDG